MRRGTRTTKPVGIIVLKQLQKHEWIFLFPRLTEEVDDRLEIAIDWMGCNVRLARSCLRALTRDYPEHLDAYHHLAMTWYRQGKMARAAEAWREGVELALKLFPANFSMGRDQLSWGFIENRPFLRLFHGYGLSLLRKGETEKALDVFNSLLAMNPNDNQGARAMVVECNLALKRSEAVLALCGRYRRDGLEHVAFGLPLALYQLGREKEASRAFRQAMKWWPLIAEELARETHPPVKGWNGPRVTHASKEQAYGYWKEHGRFWRGTPGAIAFARAIVRL